MYVVWYSRLRDVFFGLVSVRSIINFLFLMNTSVLQLWNVSIAKITILHDTQQLHHSLIILKVHRQTTLWCNRDPVLLRHVKFTMRSDPATTYNETQQQLNTDLDCRNITDRNTLSSWILSEKSKKEFINWINRNTREIHIKY